MKPRLLAVLPDHPHPATMGSRVRNIAILSALAPRFDLSILTLVHDPDLLRDPGPVAHLGDWRPVVAWHRRGPFHRVLGQVGYRAFGRGWGREAWFQASRSLARAAGECLRDRPPAIVHAAYWFTLRHLHDRPRPPLWVVDTHDVQFERTERLSGRVNAQERAGEIEELSRNDLVIAITPRDADSFRRVLGKGTRIETIGMGVDFAHWGQAAGAASRVRSDSIVYYGNLSTGANRAAAIHLCTEILPLLRARRPSVAVVLLGADPSPDVRALASITGVHVTGTLADVRPVLASCGAFALCLRAASGIRSRAAEVMAMGIPVVAYAEALEGMGFEGGLHYLAARDPGEFAAALNQVLSDSVLAARLCGAARDHVGRDFSIDATYAHFPGLYMELLEQRAKGMAAGATGEGDGASRTEQGRAPGDPRGPIPEAS